MNKNLLIISSYLDISPLEDFLTELKKKSDFFCILSNNKNTNKMSQKNGWLNKRFGMSCPGGKVGGAFFAFMLPVRIIFLFFILIFYKFVKKVDTIVCFSWPEKILVTPASRLLKIKVVWFECPNSNCQHKNGFLFFVYKSLSGFVKIITVSDHLKRGLIRLGINEERIKVVQPGINLSAFKRQENIFTHLANHDNRSQGKKFFTIGTVLDLDDAQKLEILFRAVQNALTVIPNIQLVVMGEGKEKKRLAWIAKKMEIEGLTWFVGRPAVLKKWLENIDVFATSFDNLDLGDMNVVIQAMAASVPVVAPNGIGLNDIIRDGENGILIEADSSEMLTQAIIRLEQNKSFRKKLGEDGRNKIDKLFSSDTMVNQFIKHLDS